MLKEILESLHIIISYLGKLKFHYFIFMSDDHIYIMCKATFEPVKCIRKHSFSNKFKPNSSKNNLRCGLMNEQYLFYICGSSIHSTYVYACVIT